MDNDEHGAMVAPYIERGVERGRDESKVTIVKLFWLWVNSEISYIDEMTGDWENSIPYFKKIAKKLNIVWEDENLWKTKHWINNKFHWK